MLENFRNNLKEGFLYFPLLVGTAVVAVLLNEGAERYVLPLCPDFLREWLLFPIYKPAPYDCMITPLFMLSVFFSLVLEFKIISFVQKRKK